MLVDVDKPSTAMLVLRTAKAHPPDGKAMPPVAAVVEATCAAPTRPAGIQRGPLDVVKNVLLPVSVAAPKIVAARPPELYTPVELILPVMSALGTTLPSGLTRIIVLLPAAPIVAPTFSGRQAMTRLSPSAERVIRPVLTVELVSVQPAESSEPPALRTAGPVGSAIVCNSAFVKGEYSSRNASRAIAEPERACCPLPRRRTTRLDG